MIGQRTIAAVISGGSAKAVIERTAVEAHPRDRVRILYPRPGGTYTMMDWQLPDDHCEATHSATMQRIDEVTASLRVQRPDLQVESHVVDKASVRRLERLLADAELVVVPAPEDYERYLLVRDVVAATPCPVLVVSDAPIATARLRSAVVVLVRDTASDAGVVRAACAQAVHRHCGLLAVHARVLPADADALSDMVGEQIVLDEWLSGFAGEFPGLPMTAEVVSDTEAALSQRIADLALQPMLVVVGVAIDTPSQLPFIDPLVSLLLHFRHQPTLLVPRTNSRPTSRVKSAWQSGAPARDRVLIS